MFRFGTRKTCILGGLISSISLLVSSYCNTTLSIIIRESLQGSESQQNFVNIINDPVFVIIFFVIFFNWTKDKIQPFLFWSKFGVWTNQRSDITKFNQWETGEIQILNLYICYLSIWFCDCSYGLLGGFGLGLMYVPAVVCVSQYFNKQLSLATGTIVLNQSWDINNSTVNPKY